MKFFAAIVALCAVFAFVAAAPKPDPKPIYPWVMPLNGVYGGAGASASAVADVTAGLYNNGYGLPLLGSPYGSSLYGPTLGGWIY